MVYLGNWHGLVCRELLIAFRRKTNRRPERIIFYRYVFQILFFVHFFYAIE